MLVIGLIFRDNKEVSNYVDCVGQPRLKEKYFSSINKTLSYEKIENAVDKHIWRDNDKDVVKFVTLYLAFVGLLGIDNRKLIQDFFCI